MASSQKPPLSPEISFSIEQSRKEGKKSETINDITTEKRLENYMSPYHSQFEELSAIGHGGFGVVVKAKHLLDSMIYAVKKVRIEKWYSEEILNEVRILARLDHPNVVNYKQAWIEHYNGTENLLSLQSSQSYSQTITDSSSDIRKGIEDVKLVSKKASKDREDSMVSDNALQSSQEKGPLDVLYIQMRLCEQNLREWLDKRKDNFSSSWNIEKIATQILSGINYIHSRRVIHHDINPQNIFVSMGPRRISVQLGDFGLACHCQKDNKSRKHSQQIGTTWYIAPEQLELTCHPKSDIYSFGIVLFELLYPMQTSMERALQIKDAKINKIPNDVRKRFPNWVPILKKALRADLASRPSAGELLKLIVSINICKEKQKRVKLEQKVEKLKAENTFYRLQLRCM